MRRGGRNQGGLESHDWVPMYLPDADLPMPAWADHGNMCSTLSKQIKHSEAPTAPIALSCR